MLLFLISKMEGGLDSLQSEAYATGHTAGLIVGRKNALSSGIHLGSLSGLNLYARISFYLSASTTLLPHTTHPSITKALESIIKICEEFPERNDVSVDMVLILRDVEARWKIVCNSLRLPKELKGKLMGYEEGERRAENVGKTPAELDF